MKILALRISDFRGIRDFEFEPQGENFLIWGPNGTGKSGVVDAIDFLMTGKIARLAGEGTDGITLNKHGPHIDAAEPEISFVEAMVQLPEVDEAITISRNISNKNLNFDPEFEDAVNAVIELASRYQFVLSRKDILNFITARASTRAEKIQKLLNITDVERVRSNLVSVKGTLKSELDSLDRAVRDKEIEVATTGELQTFDESKLLDSINEKRRICGAPPLSELVAAYLKSGVENTDVESSVEATTYQKFERFHQTVLDFLHSPELQNAETWLHSIYGLAKVLQSNVNLHRDIQRKELTEMGLSLLDETHNCPLCDYEWNPDVLQDKLEERLKKLESVTEIQDLCQRLQHFIEQPLFLFEQAAEFSEELGATDKTQVFNNKLADLKQVEALTSDYMTLVTDRDLDIQSLPAKLVGEKEQLIEVLSSLDSQASENYPQRSPEDDAWDYLTQVEVLLTSLEKSRIDREVAQVKYERATLLHDTFLETRDKILGEVYEKIQDRFTHFYRRLHGPDEQNFLAELQPDEGSLKLEVDFHDRGMHPPHALHSEGHQDSMGLCLFLALSEYVSAERLKVTVLDDVVMSVDSTHRRQFCRLLAEEFPDRQFIITTHEQAWAMQLSKEGVVRRRNIREFYDWDIDLGPRVNEVTEVWDRIQIDLEQNDVPSAAAKLRRYLEYFHRQVCDNLRASVVFKIDGQYELGDFMNSARQRLKELINEAKKAAKSWENDENIKQLNKLEDLRKEAYREQHSENWQVNFNVHYNEWADYQAHEFEPVVNAWREVTALFQCDSCESFIYLVEANHKPQNIRCNCQKVSWNLQKK